MITLLDCSHWNTIDYRKARDKGVEGLIIKVSQGAAYRDPKAAEHYAGARSVGMLTGAYHFVTNDNAIKQHANFEGAMAALGKWDLPPDLDCEAYTSYGGEIYSVREMRQYVLPMLIGDAPSRSASRRDPFGIPGQAHCPLTAIDDPPLHSSVTGNHGPVRPGGGSSHCPDAR
jgi:hypothetical protein